jgi:hypothetical protein
LCILLNLTFMKMVLLFAYPSYMCHVTSDTLAWGNTIDVFATEHVWGSAITLRNLKIISKIIKTLQKLGRSLLLSFRSPFHSRTSGVASTRSHASLNSPRMLRGQWNNLSNTRSLYRSKHSLPDVS